ncbi:FAD-dependent oxidoreductase [Roseomonas sp. CCTCC AB2023176]|uniref:FAD-dependent oxidoreductase n=1 Tax=Roseomonas sp. CCTCC AB2023176 TaxID=3342640 RepID=UPI0035D78B1A
MTRDRVLVAGAGPVGLTAALWLARAGVPVTVLERRDSLNTASRASTFHPPTIAILHALGVAGVILREGALVDRIQHRSPDAVLAEFRLDLLADETPFPARRHLEQARLTPDMAAALPQGSLRFDAGVAMVDQDGDGVTAVLESGVRVTGRLLIAADGARSRVRDALGIGFPGTDYPHKVLRVMTEDDLMQRLPGLAPISYLHNGRFSASFLRMPDLWRIILRVPAEVPEEVAMADDWTLARLRDVLPSWTRLPAIARRDVYGASRRVADRVVQGRIVLIGDAAHVTNTRGGMNMNAGIHDAAAVARAIAMSWPALDLRAVHAAAAERHRVAQDMLLPRTDRSVAATADWLADLRALADDPRRARAYLRETAMLDMLPRDLVAGPRARVTT